MSGYPAPIRRSSHSTGEYVRDIIAHPNGLESHWALFKRGLNDIYHHVSAKHLHHYSGEFEGRHNNLPYDTADQLSRMAQGTAGKRLPYAALIGPPETRQPRMI